MRARLVPALFVAAGLGLIGTGSAFAYADAPAVATPADAPPAATGDPLSGTRNNLQQAGLPLALLGGGVGQLTDGSRQLDDGAHQLADGLAQASAGGQQLADGLGQLQGGVGLLGDGATQVSEGVDQVVDRLTGFGEMQAGVTEQLTVVAGTLRQSPDPVSQEAAARLDGLVGRLNTEGLGPETLAQLEQLRGGARQLAYELSDPDAQFVAGMVQAADGSRQLRDGLMLLDDGGRQLVDGTGQLVDGVGPVTGVIEESRTTCGKRRPRCRSRRPRRRRATSRRRRRRPPSGSGGRMRSSRWGRWCSPCRHCCRTCCGRMSHAFDRTEPM
ncbi:hypothetical protein ACYAFX_01360 [Rhodococcus aetherivorans]